MIEEKWLSIDGYPMYEVSNLGRVRSIDTVLIDIKGKRRRWKGRILKTTLTKAGYVLVSLSKSPGSTKLLHRLVALAFIDNHHKKPCVNHIDGNKLNNRIDNLEWVTHSENEIHSYRSLGKIANTTHLGLSGIDCVRSKPVAIVSELDNSIISVTPTITRMSALTKIDPEAIRDVCNGKKSNHKGMAFKWVSKQIYDRFITADIQDCIYEVEEYLFNDKRAPEAQLSMEFPEDVNEEAL